MFHFCSPTPTMSWIKMGDKLPLRTQFNNFGKLLSISSVDESDSGKYMCKAHNSEGEAVHYIDVIVEGRSEHVFVAAFAFASKRAFVYFLVSTQHESS